MRRPGSDVLDPKIHHNNLINSILAKIEANVAGADDALMLDARGFVAETNATNLFAVLDSVVTTPFAHACPAGITRATVLELCAANAIRCREADLSLAQLYTADEVFCSGTIGEIASITSIDGRTIADGDVGPLSRQVTDLYHAHAATAGLPLDLAAARRT